MNSFSRILGILSFVFFYTFISQAQDILSDYKTIYKKLSGVKSMEIKMKVDMMDSTGTILPGQTKRFSIKKEGKKILYQMDRIEMCLTNEHAIWVFHETKNMMFQERGSSNNYNQWENSMFDWDSLGKMMEDQDIKFMGINNNEKYYLLSKGREKAHIWIDVLSGMYKKIMYDQIDPFTSEKHKVRVIFEDFDIAPNFREGTFGLGNYMEGDKGSFRPIAKYNGYTILE